ncbi:MAG: bifunctional folylpolyglutamate synthase/dihydrofolate synthase [Nitrospinales bacterium]
MAQLNYQDSLKYLYGLTESGIKLGLENTSLLLKYLGDPQLKIRTIHIAGTNGKGSTAAMIHSILCAAGYRVGLYTSPHLSDFRERIQMNGTPIEEEELVALVDRVREVSEKLKIPVTYFEFATVMAFLYFYEKNVDWGVIEVGLGGRLDATNLCQADICIISSIGLDHMEHLGSDLKGIAGEKAAIIKRGSKVFTAVDNEDLLAVIREKTRNQNASLKCFGEDFRAVARSSGQRGQEIDFFIESRKLEKLFLPLIGRHQVTNAALALATCLELDSQNSQISETAVRKGLQATFWPGRLEVISESPTILLDCAHNPDGVQCLTQALRENFNFDRCIFVIGMMKDKPIEVMLKIFSQIGDQFYLVKPNQPRSEDPKILRDLLAECQKPVEIVEEIPYALRLARKNSGPHDIICISGSIFTVAEARRYFADEGILKTDFGPLHPPGLGRSS